MDDYCQSLCQEYLSEEIDLGDIITLLIDRSNVELLHKLGIHFKKTHKYDLMLKCLLNNVDKGYIKSMNTLAIYFYNEEDYENMKKYYLMGVD